MNMNISKYSKQHVHFYRDNLSATIRRILEKYKIESIADLGSGDGSLLKSMFKQGYFKNLKKVIAVDISMDRIDNVRKIDEKIMGVVSDVSCLGLRDDLGLDLVVSNQVIEHLQDEEQFIREAKRILSGNGLLYLTTVFKKRYAWFFYRSNGKWTLDPTHLREYTDDHRMLYILKKYNFEILESSKSLFCFSVMDFFAKRLKFKGKDLYKNKYLSFIRKFKLPILGYYKWKIISRKLI